MFELFQRMDGGMVLALCITVCVSFVLVVLILTASWATMHSASKQAAIKREMLARGLSPAEIERLCLTESERQARDEADRKLREAQIAADLKRDLLARGLTVEQVAQIVPASQDMVRGGSDAQVLADTICAMVREDGLNRDAVANLIEAFMKRSQPQPQALHLEMIRTADRKLAGDEAQPVGVAR